MSNLYNGIWCEKYRPHTLEDIILSKETREIVDSFKQKQEIPNLLLCGSAGIGKSSLAKILTNSVLACQYLYINASDENGIDTIRNKISHFAQTKSIDGKIKAIICDEADGISTEGMRALRNVLEEYSAITRFILTANYKYKVISPIQSRCQSLDVTPPFDESVKRCCSILKKEKIIVPDDQKARLVDFIKSIYPDLRSCINQLQKYSSTGTLKLPNTKNVDVAAIIFKEIRAKNVEILRKALIESESTFNCDYVSVLKTLFDYIDEVETDINLKKLYLIIISEHLYRSAFVVDQEINAYACLLALSDPQLYQIKI